jgi:hypothetical protein
MRSIRWLAITAAAGSFSAGVAIAASQSGETSPVTADFQANIVSQKQRQCDADHLKFRLTFEGSQTSDDPRLSGNLEARVQSVVNTQNGSGYTHGKVRISDPSTGRPKFNGHVIGVIERDGGSEGFLTGRTIGPDSMRLLANFNLQQDQTTGAITGELGKDTLSGATKDPAVLTNGCRGGHGQHGHKAPKGGHEQKEHLGHP